jgi:hypothetical protein
MTSLALLLFSNYCEQPEAQFTRVALLKMYRAAERFLTATHLRDRRGSYLAGGLNIYAQRWSDRCTRTVCGGKQNRIAGRTSGCRSSAETHTLPLFSQQRIDRSAGSRAELEPVASGGSRMGRYACLARKVGNRARFLELKWAGTGSLTSPATLCAYIRVAWVPLGSGSLTSQFFLALPHLLHTFFEQHGALPRHRRSLSRHPRTRCRRQQHHHRQAPRGWHDGCTCHLEGPERCLDGLERGRGRTAVFERITVFAPVFCERDIDGESEC